MKIEVFGPRPIQVSRVRRLAKRVIGSECRARARSRALNLVFVSNSYIRRLNRLYLRRDRTTNVIAFPGEGDFLGEIYVSVDYAQREAREIGIDFPAEIDRLVVHGLLHLLGYNHTTMKNKERIYLGWRKKKVKVTVKKPVSSRGRGDGGNAA